MSMPRSHEVDEVSAPTGHHQHPWLVTYDGLGRPRLDCGRLELVNVRPFNLVPRRRGNAPGPAPGG
jgi:hypothetical protein